MLIFLHGLGSDHLVFDPLREELADLANRYEFIAPDFFGFGGTPLPAPLTRVSIAAYADQVASLAGSSRPIHLIAHSMGGAVALELLNRHPTLAVESCVSLEGNLHNDAAAISVTVSQSTREEFIATGFAHLVRATRLAAASAPSSRDWLRSLERTTAPVFYDASVDLVRASENAYETYRNCSIRRIYVLGERTVAASRVLYDRLRADGLRTALITDAGHSMLIENPRETAMVCRGNLK